MKEQVKLRAGRFMVPATLLRDGSRIFVKFKYSKSLIAEIKAMKGNRWHGFEKPPRKIWSIENCPRNNFQLAYLQGKKPYAHFEKPVVKHDYNRSLYFHQKELADFILTRRHCIIAGEIGVGKTLAAIEAMERSGYSDWWYVAPKSALRAVERELRIWKSIIHPKMMTYEALVKWMKEMEDMEIEPPRGVVFDESARTKNPNSLRSQAAKMLADGIRDDWGYEGYIVLMSGAPAPRDPVDWWHQCEVACPGFLREGTQMKFRKRLSIVVNRKTQAGGVYPAHETWLDDEDKCVTCGKIVDDVIHDLAWTSEEEGYHSYQKSMNEVALLTKRMEGLTIIRLKEDCLDLPKLRYRLIHLEPTRKILNLAKTLLGTARTVIAGITLLRELSDGFQYSKKKVGEEECSVCKGIGEIKNPIYRTPSVSEGLAEAMGEVENSISDDVEIISCDGCGGKKRRPIFERVTQQVESPKADALVDILDEHLEVGRLVIYAGFTGSIDRCIQICQNVGWEVIRADGRGWWNSVSNVDPLDLFQDMKEQYPRVVFIGQPGAAGTGLTLTASPTILYYSNTFDFDHRVQSEGRGHRPGMDLVRGCTIIDLIHLPTDELVLENLRKKRSLQALTMGNLTEALGE